MEGIFSHYVTTFLNEGINTLCSSVIYSSIEWETICNNQIFELRGIKIIINTYQISQPGKIYFKIDSCSGTYDYKIPCLEYLAIEW